MFLKNAPQVLSISHSYSIPLQSILNWLMWEGGSSCHKVRKLGELIDCRSKDVSAWTYDIHPSGLMKYFTVEMFQ